jgi:nitroimidazol reductase NimA-like FMN-containing flavoprotein (pyridoxamine 5'-phosphate oxidase superfamily)
MSTVWDHDEGTGTAAELSEQECWTELRRASFGRLGYHLAGEVDIVPISIVVDGGSIVFRTAEGSKLLGLHMSGDVVLEVDDVAGASATSVVARGRARVLSGADEERALALPLGTWTPHWTGTFVAIDVREVTGRRFTRRA